MRLAIDLVTLSILLFLVHEGFRRAGKWVAWGVFFGLAAILSPYWIGTVHTHAFPWVKLYTILFSTCWFTGLRYTSFGSWRWVRFASYLILPVNILEAVAQVETLLRPNMIV